MPLWAEMDGLLTTAHYSSLVGQGLGKLSDYVGMGTIGSVLGEFLGLRFAGGFSRGDWLVENLDKGTRSLIEVAKHDFLEHIEPALKSDFG